MGSASQQAANASATATKAKVGGAEERAARKAVSRIEKRLARITVEETAINAEILEQAQDYERLAELSARLTALATEKDELELEWLEASELLRVASAQPANGASSVRSSAASRVRSLSGSSARNVCSASISAVKAPSTVALPSGVSRTSTPRRSCGVGQPLDQAARGQPVDPVGHRPAGHQGLAQQAAGGELVRRPRAAQRREHVELPRLDLRGRERVAAGQVEVSAEPADPAEDLDRGEVEVGPLARPCLDQLVDLVSHGSEPIGSVENLDIKIN